MDLPSQPPHGLDARSIAGTAPPARPGPLGGIGMVVLYFVMQLAVGFVVGLVLAFGYALVVGAEGGGMTGESITDWIRTPGGKLVLTAVTLVFVAALMLWIIHRRWPAQWSVARPPGFGFVAPEDTWFFLWAALIAAGWAIGGSFLTEALARGQPIHQDVTVMASQVPLGLHLALAFVVVCVAPIVEEALFRGVLLSGLMRAMPAAWAVLISAIIFGGVHYPDFGFVWYPLPTLILGGVLLGWIRLQSRSLWPSITLHAANNLIAVVGWFAASGAHS